MKTIWKFNLKGLDEQVIPVPKGTKLLACKEQFDMPVLYGLVDPNEKEKESIAVKVFGTGHPIDVNMTSWTYLDTVVTFNGNLVWHVFYK